MPRPEDAWRWLGQVAGAVTVGGVTLGVRERPPPPPCGCALFYLHLHHAPHQEPGIFTLCSAKTLRCMWLCDVASPLSCLQGTELTIGEFVHQFYGFTRSERLLRIKSHNNNINNNSSVPSPAPPRPLCPCVPARPSTGYRAPRDCHVSAAWCQRVTRARPAFSITLS
eukprot:scaffold123079_cov63-Phaeocystis_antarctica.AAC.1